MKRLFTILVLFVLSSCATTGQRVTVDLSKYQDPAFRKNIPSPGPQPELLAPKATREVLSNGLTLITVEKNSLPLIHTRLVFKSGSSADPANLPGLAGFTSAMMKAGTTSKSAQELADEVETRGSSILSGVSEDTTSFAFSSLSENYEPILNVLADMIQNPNFAAEEITRERAKRLTALAQSKDDPRKIASKIFKKSVFGSHPYGHNVLGTEQAVKAIEASHLRQYYQAHIRPANAAMIVVGNITSAKAKASIEKALQQWTSQDGILDAPKNPEANAQGLFLIDKPGAAQSQLRIGHLGVARNHPDYFSIVMCNAILGGVFNSRINMNLREDKGYTYGARSSFSFHRGKGSFGVYTGVKSDVTALAITEVLKEIELIRGANVSEEELTTAKNSYSLSLPGYFQTVSGIASMFSNIFIYDLPMDYYQELPANLAKVTVADVRRVAQKYIQPEKLAIIIVGDKKTVSPTLQTLGRGKIQLLDTKGNPL